MSKVCVEWELARRRKHHRRKLKNVRPTSQSNARTARAGLDNSAPRSCTHLDLNLKRAFLEEQEQARVNSENALLTNKVRDHFLLHQQLWFDYGSNERTLHRIRCARSKGGGEETARRTSMCLEPD